LRVKDCSLVKECSRSKSSKIKETSFLIVPYCNSGRGRTALHDSALVGRFDAAFNTDIALDRDHQFRSSDRFSRAGYGNGFGVDRGFGDGCRDGLGRCNGQGGG
jgi:hypothetical protein